MTSLFTVLLLQAPPLRLLWINAGILLLLLTFVSVIVTVLVRRSIRQRVEAERVSAMATASARILHQVKNPLSSLLLHAELLGDARTAGTEGERREAGDAVLQEGARVRELLEELSAFAQGRRRDLDLAPVPLHELVAAAASSEGRAARHEGIEVVTERLDEVDVLADVYFLRQAVDNLIRNAREALAEHGARGGAPRVRVSVRRAGREALVEIADNGPGIPPAERAAVFEPFHTSKHRGMGLGLPVCREIAAGHGGRLELREARGGGARFVLALPIER
ncbi:MAG: HAMP domain-containing sensor histidine kinase [Gemmatimonadota bacterium]